MVTLVETTELSEMHDAEAKWTQLWKISEGATATCLCHADNYQTKNGQKYISRNSDKNVSEDGITGGLLVHLFAPLLSA